MLPVGPGNVAGFNLLMLPCFSGTLDCYLKAGASRDFGSRHPWVDHTQGHDCLRVRKRHSL